MVHKFLELYKQLEQELKNDNKTVAEYENTLNNIDVEKLKLCRMIRNYLSHNDMKFVTVTREQLKFLTDIKSKVIQKSYTAGKAMKKIKLIHENMLIKDMLGLIDKSHLLPLNTGRGYYLITKDIIISHLALGSQKIKLPRTLPTYQYTHKDVRVSKLKNTIYIVTDTGKKTGKYLGILNLKEVTL